MHLLLHIFSPNFLISCFTLVFDLYSLFWYSCLSDCYLLKYVSFTFSFFFQLLLVTKLSYLFHFIHNPYYNLFSSSCNKFLWKFLVHASIQNSILSPMSRLQRDDYPFIFVFGIYSSLVEFPATFEDPQPGGLGCTF